MSIAFDLTLKQGTFAYKPTPYNSLEMLTERLWLRRWTIEDVPNFVAMRSNAQGMEFFPGHMNPALSMAIIEAAEKQFDEQKYGFWVLESIATGEFIGSVGLYEHKLPGGAKQMAIFWQLMPGHWGRGYATEAANAVIDYGFKKLKFKQIVALIHHANWSSRQLAERLGMTLMQAVVPAEESSIQSGECTYRLSCRAARRK